MEFKDLSRSDKADVIGKRFLVDALAVSDEASEASMIAAWQHGDVRLLRTDDGEQMFPDGGDLAPDLFREAARLIERALLQFDLEERSCTGCGNKRFVNFPHAIAYRQFTDTPRKLMDSADELSQAVGGFQPFTMKAARQVGETGPAPAPREPGDKAVAQVRKSESRKRSAPWEGRGRRD